MGRVTALSRKDKKLNTVIYNSYRRLQMEDGWYGNDKLQNYKQMMRIIDITDISLDNTSCLDVGCGTGDLSAFAKRLGATDYVGVDIYKPAIDKARRKYPEEKFIWGDFLKIGLKQKFDFSFCSGSLSVKLRTDNYKFLESVIAKMWKASKVGVAFNVLTDDDRNPDKDLFFYNKEKLESICRKIAKTGNIAIKKHPSRAELHVYMYR